MRSTPTPTLQIVSWNLTQHCNLRCVHCYLDAEFRTSSHAGGLTTAQAITVVNQVADASPGCMLIVSGGEPLLRKDLVDVVGHASDVGLFVVVGTNGVLLTPRMARRLRDAGVRGLGISLDSTNPQRHDAFRGVPGAWKRAVRAIEICRAEGLRFQLHASVTQSNFDEIRSLIEFASARGASAFNLFFLVCTGRGETLTDISPTQYEDLLRKLVSWAHDFPTMLIRARCAPHYVQIADRMATDGRIGMAPAGCMAGKAYCRIDPEGYVTPCPYIPTVAGNVFEEPLSRIWSESSTMRILRESSTEGRCGVCEYASRCGGCRARALALNGSLMAEDPWCSYRPSASEKPGRSVVGVPWSGEAEARLARVPAFVRPLVKDAVEAYAAKRGLSEISPEVMSAVRADSARSGLPFADRGRKGSALGVDGLDQSQPPTAGPDSSKDTDRGRQAGRGEGDRSSRRDRRDSR